MGVRSDGQPELVTQRAAGAPLPLHVYLLAGVFAALGGMLGMTQWIAAHFGYDPRLGRPVLVVPDGQRLVLGCCALLLAGLSLRLLADPARRRRAPVLLIGACLLGLAWHGPVYHPARVLEWWPQLRARPDAEPLIARARLLGTLLFCLIGGGTLAGVRPARTKQASVSHGSAAWGTGDEFRATPEETRRLRAGLGLEGTLILGRHRDGSLLVLRESMGHLLTMASTRSGKGVGTVLPNALAYRGSMIFSDPKAEAFFVTAEHRRTRLGHRIYALDPFEVTVLEGREPHDMRAFYNPLRQVPTTGPAARLALDRIRALAETLILESKGENAFWDRMARQVTTGILLYICYQFDAGLSPQSAFPVETPFGRDLLTLRFLTCLGADDFQAVLNHMGRCDHPEVRRVANILLGADYRTRQNIMTSAQAQLAFLDSPQMAAVLGEFIRSDRGGASRPNPLAHADLHLIKTEGVRQTVYLVIPPSFLETHAPWLRLMIVAINDIITRTTAPPDLPIVMMLDEFANLGRIDAVRRGVSLVGGYGVRFWMIVQDLQQVESVYDKAWGTMFANAFVKQLFGTNDLRTAKELSELTGDATVYADSGNSGKSLDSAGWIGKGTSVGESLGEKGRKLLLPDEVLGMPPEKQLLQVRGHRPLYAAKLNYLEMEEVQGLYAPNPMY
ncbi:MAG: conjugal transfer protein TraG [Gemmatimonadetes bacterium]|nr:conjugal transfer protein TraG [Gemmatimonadota bacterium]